MAHATLDANLLLSRSSETAHL